MKNDIESRIADRRWYDPRRWPGGLSEGDRQLILDEIYGHPDEYSQETYAGQENAEVLILAAETRRFIAEHVRTEQLVLKQTMESQQERRTILDLGCRDGRLLAEMLFGSPRSPRLFTFRNYIGVEIDDQMHILLEKRTSRVPDAESVLGDITKLDEVLTGAELEIESPVVCLLQNTLGTIAGEGNWADVISQLSWFMGEYTKAEIILSLYRSVNSSLTVGQIQDALEIIEQHEKTDSDMAPPELKEAVVLLGNGWLIPSYLHTKSQNGWPPDPEKLTKGIFHIPSTGYTSCQWSESDVAEIVDRLDAEVTIREKQDEFVVLRLRRE